MAERKDPMCSKCGKVYRRDQLTWIPEGFGRKRIPGPKSPVGWSKVSQARFVRFPLGYLICGTCDGKPADPVPVGNEAMRQAAEFKRFFPPTR